MAKETKDQEGEEKAPEEDLLEVLEKKTKTTRTLLIVCAVSTLVLLNSLILGYFSVSYRVNTQSQATLNEMMQLSGRMSEEFTGLNLALEFNNHQIELSTARIDALDPKVDKQQFALIKSVMLGQERDSQYFFETVKVAVAGLSEMITGSREWRDDFNEKLDLAIAISAERELSLVDEIDAQQLELDQTPPLSVIDELGQGSELTESSGEP